ncbi:hypothetical protein G4B88_015918 [Cannabis sativa]|uniref:Uncharacterized protein n=1 Tax=Cannabis sativa TaxID=3483 RepID=A0A7J6ESQ9_CANSA|nr:hypothetical protein G4B88_015918 [Cannabis sativa]
MLRIDLKGVSVRSFGRCWDLEVSSWNTVIIGFQVAADTDPNHNQGSFGYPHFKWSSKRKGSASQQGIFT